MAVITISRELGSEGSYIARETALRLGYSFVDKSIITEVFKQYGLVSFPERYETAAGFWARSDRVNEQIIALLNSIILTVAFHGNAVILGRGSFAVLGGYADVLNVRIQAPFSTRVQRIMHERGISDQAAAEALVKESDSLRSGFIHSWYDQRWDAAGSFDLVIDTGKIPREIAVDWLIEAHDALLAAPAGEKLTTGAIQVDLVLEGAVAQVLNSQAPLHH